MRFTNIMKLLLGILVIGCVAFLMPASANDPSFTYFNFDRLEFQTRAEKMEFFDLPAAPASADRPIGDDVEMYLRGNTRTPAWMEAFGRLTYAAEPLPEAPSRMTTEADMRWKHLIELRRVASKTAPATPVEPLYRRYLVGSRIKDRRAPGGFGASENLPQRIPSKLKPTRAKLQLVARPEDITMYDGQTRGYSLYLVNDGVKTEEFSAADSNIGIFCEALALDGTWKPIDRRPNYFCGNSYHRVFLDPNKCWKITVPEYTGDYETRVRYRLERPNEDDIVSNEVTTKLPKALMEWQEPTSPTR